MALKSTVKYTVPWSERSVTIGKGTVIRDSIIMQGVTIGENCVIDKAIIAEDTVIGDERFHWNRRVKHRVN